MNDEQIAQDTQPPQQAQWTRKGRKIHGNGVEIIALTVNDAALGTGILNAQQQRIVAAEKVAGRNAELIADSLDDVLQWRTIADTAQARIVALEDQVNEDIENLIQLHLRVVALEAALREFYWSVATSDGKPLGIAPSQHHLDKARAALIFPSEAK